MDMISAGYIAIATIMGVLMGGVFTFLMVKAQYQQKEQTQESKLEVYGLSLMKDLNDLREAAENIPEPFNENAERIKDGSYLIIDKIVDMAILIEDNERYELLLRKARQLISEADEDITKSDYLRIIDNLMNALRSVLVAEKGHLGLLNNIA